MHQIKWLWGNMDAPYKKRLITALIISVVTSAMLLINPALQAVLVDEVIIAGNVSPLVSILAWMLAFKLVREGMRYMMIIFLEQSSQNVVLNLRRLLFNKLQYQDLRFFDRNRTGDLMTRMSADLDWCRHFLSHIDYSCVDGVCMFLFTTIYLLFVNWKLTLMLVLVTPLLLIITKVYSSRVRPLFVEMREKLSNLNTAAQENIAGNRVVKAFAREEYEKERFDEKNRAFRQSHLNINKKWLSFYPAIEMLANVMTLITVFVGGVFIINGELTPGQLTVFTSLSWALSNPMRNLGILLNDYQRFSSCCTKVMEVALSVPRVRDAAGASDHAKMRGKIEFRNVSFQIEKEWILRDVSFTLEPGQTLAIMGATGSGKTTIINLLARFYDVTQGEVLVDDDNIKHWHLAQLRGQIGTATQDVFLFSDTVDGNIAFGNLGLSELEVKDFARRADADSFIQKLPEKYDTIIGERGVGLSGGQRQRIALARAMAVKPAILVMDDTTSAVDMETEQYIQDQLKHLPFECTKVVIAQRISSVKEADLILVLEDGRVVQRGTHDELIHQPGYYYDTYALQNDLPAFEEVKG